VVGGGTRAPGLVGPRDDRDQPVPADAEPSTSRFSASTVTIVLVAVAYAALAYADGGFSDQLIAAATVGLWWVVIIAIATRVWPGRVIPRSAIAAGLCLAALAVFTALSMIWADSAGLAFTEVVRVAGYLGLFVLVVLASARTGPRPWLIGLAIGLAIVVAGALASRFDPSLFGGADREIFEFIPFAHGRLSYPLGYWNALGACLGLGIALLGWLGADAHIRLGRAAAAAALPAFGLALYLTSSRGGLAAAVVGGVALLALSRAWPQQLVTFALGGIGTAVLVGVASIQDDFTNALTTHTAYVQGREMAVATIVCVLLVGAARYLVDGRVARIRISTRVVRIGLAAVIVAGIVALAASGPVDRIRDFSNADQGAGSGPRVGAQHFTATSGTGRYQLWGEAVDAFESRPVWGIGAGNYELFWNVHAPFKVAILDAHSLYLETLAELGVVGFALLLAFVVAALIAGWRRAAGWRAAGRGDAVAAAMALLLASLVSAALDWTWEVPAVFGVAILAAALLTGPATVPEVRADRAQERAAERAARRWVPGRLLGGGQYGLGVATLVVAWLAIWVAGDQLFAKIQLDSSRNAVDRGDLTAAAQDARDAAAIQPWASEPQLQLALVETQSGDLGAASVAVTKAITRSPTDWRTWLVAAQVEAALGLREAAQQDLDKANELSPTGLPELAPAR
jgi:hypothetical protein